MDTGFRALATIGICGCGSYYAFLSNQAFYEALKTIPAGTTVTFNEKYLVLPTIAMVFCTAMIWYNRDRRSDIVLAKETA